jgi:hypothetical protein
MTTPPCRPFYDTANTVQQTNYLGQSWEFGWDGKFLFVAYPNGTVDEFLDVSRGVAQQIFFSTNPLATFNQLKPNLIPVLMFTENFTNGAWQIETGAYLTTKGP